MLGSIRDDCEQMTGRCVCRSNVVGVKCDRCQDGQLIDNVAGGCGANDASENESHHCFELTCRYGAICQDLQGQAVCVCPMDCPVSASTDQTVCGSDGVSYGSECDLRLAACRKQAIISLSYEGSCLEEMTTKATTGAELETAVSKATRHVQETDMALPEWGRRDTVSLTQIGSQASQYSFSRPIWRPTVATARVRGYLGDRCAQDTQCQAVADSACILGVCTCVDGFAEDSERRFCLGEISSFHSSSCTVAIRQLYT